MANTQQAPELASVEKVRAWTRNDTARWLNDRSPSVLAWLRRTDPAHAPAYSASMGRWIQTQRPTLFVRAHRRLSALATPAEREAYPLLSLLS